MRPTAAGAQTARTFAMLAVAALNLEMIHRLPPLLLLVICQAACAPVAAPASRVYLAQGLDHQRIQLIWLELPALLEADTVPIRLFMAGADPPQPILPIDVELPCRLESASQYAALGPITIPFDVAEDGSLSGSYTWYSCAECVECYMRWQYTMEMTVAVREREVTLSIESVHFGHNVQGEYLSAVVPLARNAGVQPQIECNRLNECKEVHFVPKTSP